MSLADFTNAYIEALLFSTHDDSTDSGGQPLDANYTAEDLHPDARARIDADCAAFYAAHSALWQGERARLTGCTDDEKAGHDFWMTRAGHGVGFWDGDWHDPAATVLTHACQVIGNVDPYIGDDGKIHLM